MDIDFIAHVEMTLDNYRQRIEALEKTLTELPEVVLQPDASRTQGVIIDPSIAPAPKRP